LDVVRLEARIVPQLFGDHTHLRQPGDVVAVVAGHHLAVVGSALGCRGDDGRGLAQIAGALGGGDHQCDAAVALLAAIQQSQHRFDDPPRILMVFQRDRALVEPRVGVRRGMGPVDDGEPGSLRVPALPRRVWGWW